MQLLFKGTIKCETSCMKFDGYTPTGKRVIMRDCGYFDTEECVYDVDFEDGTATGTICHCKEGNCNHAAEASVLSVAAVATSMFLAWMNY